MLSFQFIKFFPLTIAFILLNSCLGRPPEEKKKTSAAFSINTDYDFIVIKGSHSLTNYHIHWMNKDQSIETLQRFVDQFKNTKCIKNVT